MSSDVFLKFNYIINDINYINKLIYNGILKLKFNSFYKTLLFYSKNSKFINQLHYSTINHNDIKPFWNNQIKSLSDKLWLPNYSKNISNKVSQKIINKHSNLDRQNTYNYRYCRKIRFYPNKYQKTLFEKCFGCSRFIYNEGSKSYKCSKCHLEIDRDVNGARKIYLKNIGLDESL